MDRIRLAIWTFMLLLFSVTIWGDEIYFRSLGVKDGLSQPSSIAIWQDRLGRIWLGNNAVNCYDGISTKVIVCLNISRLSKMPIFIISVEMILHYIF